MRNVQQKQTPKLQSAAQVAETLVKHVLGLTFFHEHLLVQAHKAKT